MVIIKMGMTTTTNIIYIFAYEFAMKKFEIKMCQVSKQ